MSKKNIFLLVASLLILTSACSGDVLDLSTETTTGNTNAPRGFVSMDQAKARLANIVGQLNSQTADASQRFPAVTPSRLTGVALGADMKPLTRADDQTQAGCYLLRMDNDMFAIMSATTSRPELLAIGNGYPNFEDSTALLPNPAYWNPGIGVTDSAIVNPNRCDTMYEEPINVVYRIVKRDLVPVKWGNKAPYNEKCPMIPYGSDSIQAVVGCVGVAVGQIMTAENYRNSWYEDHCYAWDLLTKFTYAEDFDEDPEAREMVATLFQDITNEENIDPSPYPWGWGYPVTNASSWNVRRTFEHFNFENPGSGVVPYDFDTVKAEIEEGYPVYFDARGGTDSIVRPNPGGHAWVCHGLLEATVTMGVFTFDKNGKDAPQLINTYTLEPSYYFQMNWGWNAKADGFYLAKFDDFIDNKKGPDIPENQTNPKNGYNIYYPNTTKIIYGMRLYR